jgi:alginate O-acetyltransferase complex protein AlgI
VIGGAFHGLFLVLDRLFLLKWLKKIGKYPAVLFTFFITLMGWVLFRAENFNHALDYYQVLFTFPAGEFLIDADLKFIVMLFLAFLFSFSGLIHGAEAAQQRWLGPEIAFIRIKAGWVWGLKMGIALVLFLLSLASVISSGFNPFIYFRF